MRRRPREFNPRVVVVPHDGEPNPDNPYDGLSPKERHERVVELCARIYARMRSEQRSQGGGQYTRS